MLKCMMFFTFVAWNIFAQLCISKQLVSRKKKVFLKLKKVFFIWTCNLIVTKVITFSESPSKIKVMLLQIFIFILLIFVQLFNIETFCMEKNLCNVFRNTNTKDIRDPILGSCHNVPQRKVKIMTLQCLRKV